MDEYQKSILVHQPDNGDAEAQCHSEYFEEIVTINPNEEVYTTEKSEPTSYFNNNPYLNASHTKRSSRCDHNNSSNEQPSFLSRLVIAIVVTGIFVGICYAFNLVPWLFYILLFVCCSYCFYLAPRDSKGGVKDGVITYCLYCVLIVIATLFAKAIPSVHYTGHDKNYKDVSYTRYTLGDFKGHKLDLFENYEYNINSESFGKR